MKIFNKKTGVVHAFVEGVIAPIDKSSDPMFSEKVMGDGFLIHPHSPTIYAPIDGIVSMVFPTGHAIGLKNEQGKSYLIHIGIDTVHLNGEGFQVYIQEGQLIKCGDKIMDVNFEEIRTKVPSIEILYVSTDGEKCQLLKDGLVQSKEKVAFFK